jgi:hypothetical protein
MSNQAIPDDVKQWADAVVQRFNETAIKEAARFYVPRYRGRFMYLDRLGVFGFPSQVARLTYTGDTSEWAFAIYKYSSERYDPEEWLFPGSEHVDGTLEGALKAGLDAYP